MRAPAWILALLAVSASPAFAQDLVPWPHRGGIEPIRLTSHAIDAQVRDQVAEVTLDDTFHNPNTVELEGMYFLHLPADAQVNKFSMTVNGKEQQAELLDSQKARQIYDSIVRARRDPALLELVGLQMLKASVYPIGPKSDVKVRVTYSQVLVQDGGLTCLTAPIARNAAGNTTIQQVTASVTLESRTAIKSVYSPTHAVDVVRKDDHHVKATFEARDAAFRRDFTLYYSLSDADVAIGLLTFRESSDDGFFILTAGPKLAVDPSKIMPKDVLFVVDRSGSMSGEKIRQAREALTQCLSALNAGDRFNIVDFSTEPSAFRDTLAEVAEHRAAAIRYVEGLQARGSTDIDGALDRAIRMLAPDAARVSMIFFITDGEPTVGEQNPDAILARVKSRLPEGAARIFVFGVGNDVNTSFLDRLAELGRGARDYVAPEEKIEAKVSGLFEKVSNPVLAALSLDFGGMQVAEMYPRELPDLFKGGQITLFGRYRGTGPATITLRGTASGEQRAFRYDVHFPDRDLKRDFLPRLWAGRKIAYLVDAIRLGGKASQEVVDEIVSLGKKYGIVTPYTSFLITEDSPAAMQAGARKEFERMRDDAARSGGGVGAPAAEAAREESKKLEAEKRSATEGEMDDAAGRFKQDALRAGRKVVETRSAGSKTFYLRDGVWTDGAFDEKDRDKIVKIKFLGDEYAKLIEDSPGIAKYLAVGESVIVVYEGKIYQVEP